MLASGNSENASGDSVTATWPVVRVSTAVHTESEAQDPEQELQTALAMFCIVAAQRVEVRDGYWYQ